jgi:hypothetical protein
MTNNFIHKITVTTCDRHLKKLALSTIPEHITINDRKCLTVFSLHYIIHTKEMNGSEVIVMTII